MGTKQLARRYVKPIVGQDGWQLAHDVKKSVLKAGKKNGRLLTSVLPTREPPLSEEQILARAKQIEADRERAEMAQRATSLTELAKYFRTDKWGNHFYTEHYQRHFQHLRLEKVKVLEIGIGGYRRDKDGGASLRMWKHFFPKGQIVGLDIVDKSFVREARIHTYKGSQTDPELLNRINAERGPFDIIIDDGSHRPEHIIATFDVLFPLLADDGIYVVEDTQTSYWPEWGGSDDPNDPNTSMSMLKAFCDGLNHVEYVAESYEPTYTDRHVVSVSFYHNLVFVQKGVNAEGTRRRAILKKRYAPAES